MILHLLTEAFAKNRQTDGLVREVHRAVLTERRRHVDEHALASNRTGTDGRRQIDVDAALEERRGHHEDDEQDEHDVNERDDIDLGK